MTTSILSPHKGNSKCLFLIIAIIWNLVFRFISFFWCMKFAFEVCAIESLILCKGRFRLREIIDKKCIYSLWFFFVCIPSVQKTTVLSSAFILFMYTLSMMVELQMSCKMMKRIKYLSVVALPVACLAALFRFSCGHRGSSDERLK